MYIIFLYMCLLVFSVIAGVIFYFIKKWISIKKRMFIFDHYEEILLVLEQTKIIAYKKVWQEEIVLEGVSGFNIRSSKLKTVQNRYVRLISKFCGPAIMKDLEEIHGNIDSLILFLISEFITKLNEDERLLRQYIIDGELDDEVGEGKMFIDNLIGPGAPTGS